MSIFPVFNASFAGLVLLSLFCWNIWLLPIIIICIVASICLYVYESNIFINSYAPGFWLFIISEVVVFGTLLTCCLYFDLDYYTNLSSSLELPFLGCWLLLSSSITVTGYHHLLNWGWSWLLLLLTIVLGSLFVGVQMVEMEDIIMNIYDTTFHASSLCTIGLHFSHVLMGVVGLVTILIAGTSLFGYFRCSVIVWYWHFVDYVWLFVYTFVYVC